MMVVVVDMVSAYSRRDCENITSDCLDDSWTKRVDSRKQANQLDILAWIQGSAQCSIVVARSYLYGKLL